MANPAIKTIQGCTSLHFVKGLCCANSFLLSRKNISEPMCNAARFYPASARVRAAGHMMRAVTIVSMNARSTQIGYPSALWTAFRSFARVSAMYGQIPSPVDGFVTPDIKLDHNASFGGAFARGVFAAREIGYDREIMKIPAFCTYIGNTNEEPLREQVLVLTKQVFTKLVCAPQETQDYIRSRVMTLMPGGFSYFTRERDVMDFAEEVRASGPEGALRNGTALLMGGTFSSYDLQKLPLIIEFNRVDVEYRGLRGLCLFPEACYFTHSCKANVALSITYDSAKSNFVLSARTVRPIRAGEELLIDYMPGNRYPISRLAIMMKRRWGFECSCVQCRGRAIGAAVMLFVVLLVPICVIARSFVVGRMENKIRAL